MYSTHVGAAIIDLMGVSVIMWASVNELVYNINNWQSYQVCQYTKFSIKDENSPWQVVMTGVVIKNNTSTCNSTTSLHYYSQYYPSESCYDKNYNSYSDDTEYDGLPINEKHQQICNYTQLTQELNNSLFRQFNCSVNHVCTRLEPWTSNELVVYFYIVTVCVETLTSFMLIICLVVSCIRWRREKEVERRFNQPHPPIYAPPHYTTY